MKYELVDCITQLRRISPEERVAFIRRRYENNILFFNEQYPEVVRFIEGTTSQYHLNLTQTFFDLIHTGSDSLCHSNQGLDRDAEAVAQYNHPGWLDLHNIRLQSDSAYPLHHIPVDHLRTELAKSFPACHERILNGSLPVQRDTDGRAFSQPCIFLGIFHGLHIDYFLQKNEVPSVLLIEPDPLKFEISLFFLDYREIKDRFGSLYLVIGEDTGSIAIQNFFSIHKIHVRMWCRVFQREHGEISTLYIEAIKRYQRAWTDIFFPVDVEFSSLRNGLRNIRSGLSILSRIPSLSDNSVIAIVASGPSLDQDIEWLQKNRHRILVFAVHSAVRALRSHGLKPDFQFNIDSDRDTEVVNALQLYGECPLISDYRVGREFIEATDRILLCVERAKPMVVDFDCTLEETHPSTTNLAFSFACHCQPHAIVLLGCDFGYKSNRQTHSNFSMQSEQMQQKVHRVAPSESESLVEANFTDDETVLTTSFLTYARLSIENCIQLHGEGIRIVNFSRGARISGAEALSSRDFSFPVSDTDIQKESEEIILSFSPAREGSNYRNFLISAEELSKKVKDELVQALSLPVFTRVEFSRCIDRSIDLAFEQCRTSDQDQRMSMFSKLFTDLLSIWNCYMLTTKDIAEARLVYEKGIVLIRETLDKIQGFERNE